MKHGPFTEESLKAVVDDLNSWSINTNSRITICDKVVTGLRAVVSKSGSIALSACYNFNESRPMTKLGEIGVTERDYEYMTIDDARQLTKIIHSLADKGISIEEEIAKIRQKLLRDVLEKGSNWKPGDLT